MFHWVTDASKIALVALVQHLRGRKFVLLDTQWLTPHLQQFGGIEISRNHYLRLLRRAVELPRKFFEEALTRPLFSRLGFPRSCGSASKPPKGEPPPPPRASQTSWRA